MVTSYWVIDPIWSGSPHSMGAMEEQQLKDSEKQEIKDATMSPFDISTPSLGESSRSRGLLAMVVFPAVRPGKCGRRRPCGGSL